MKILISNPGSTSYKCKLYDMTTETILFQAGVERIGDELGLLTFHFNDTESVREELTIPDYAFAVNLCLEKMKSRYSVEEVAAVGFKTVHAKDVTGCVELDESVIQAMKEYMPLVPVHNQVYLTAIGAFKRLLPEKPLVGLFETHFHTQIPDEAVMYGVPYSWVEKHGVRKYGFHGASHRYIALTAAEQFGARKIISCHLGGSSSVCAIRDGVSIDTSMGMSAQAGCLNAKRVGDLDPFALLYVMEKENLSIDAMRQILISQSGVYGLSDLSGDFRDIEEAMEVGNTKAKLAFETFAYVVKRYIGEYLAILNGADCIVFTGGLGQFSSSMRKSILSDMENLGIRLDSEKNEANPPSGLISSLDSVVQIAILPTNEELIVAREVKQWMHKQ